MRKQIYVCNADGKDNRNREQVRHPQLGWEHLVPGQLPEEPEEGSRGGTVRGQHAGCRTNVPQHPRAVHNLTFTGPGPPHESLEPPPWWYSKDKVLSNHLCLMPVLTATAATETAAV